MDAETGQIIAGYTLGVAKFLFQEVQEGSVNTKDRFLNSFHLKVEKYINKVFKRCSQTKTLLYADKAIDLRTIYTSLNLSSGSTNISDEKLIKSAIIKPRNIVISGTAGCGKSMMMKSFVLKTIASNQYKLPVFYEFRNINHKKEKPLIDNIWDFLSLSTSEFTKDRFLDALKNGKCVFVLDGFDEIDEDTVKKVELQLRELYDKYPKNTYIVSSRPDAHLNASTKMDVFHVQPMTKKQTNNLISKVQYDPSIKQAFLDELNDGLYEEHEEFVSTPLLATMMLLTYSQFANIPEKIHLFYSQVFEVLYKRHDISKEGYYQRDFKTGMPMDDFSSLFEYFSLSSYIKKSFNFSKKDALEYAAGAIEYCEAEVSKVDFIDDLMKAVCLLVQDGNRITYSHRSFQEYFSALFIAGQSLDKHYLGLIEKIQSRKSTDSVLYILFGMQRERFEKLFIKKLVTDCISGLKTDSHKVFDKFFSGLNYVRQITDNEEKKINRKTGRPYGTFDRCGTIGFGVNPFTLHLSFLIQCYPAEFEWLLNQSTLGHHKSYMSKGNKVFVVPRALCLSLADCDIKKGKYELQEMVEHGSFKTAMEKVSSEFYDSLNLILQSIDQREIRHSKTLDQILSESS